MLADYCLFYYKGELRLRLPRALCWRGAEVMTVVVGLLKCSEWAIGLS